METTILNEVKSNNLTFRTSKPVDKNIIYVTIRLNDECKNGHQDFAITGEIYRAGRPKTDGNCIAFGCIHDEIEKYFPEFKIFIKLHLCDYEGIPTYAVENGFYRLRNGSNNTKPEDNNFKNEFCDYYRITSKQFDILNNSRNQLQYAVNLQNLGILQQWKAEANEAITHLEQLTGKQFLIDSVKTQFHAPSPEEREKEEIKVNSGYYTPEAEQQRELLKRDAIIAKLAADRDKEINKATTEYEVKKQVLIIGGEKALNNCIFYNHTNQLAFNWKGYDNISQGLINTIKDEIVLPANVTIK